MKRHIVIFLFLSLCVHAQQFKIEGVISDAVYGYVTLVDLSDNSVIWEGSTPNDVANFSITAPKGNYALCISDGFTFYGNYLKISLTSDMDLGIIKCNKTPLVTEDAINGFKLVKENEKKKYILKNYKKYDMLAVLSGINIFDFRTKRETSHIGSVEIDGIPLKKNVLELSVYFKNMSAKDVEYIEITPPTEKNPGGSICIVTSQNK